MNNPQSSSTSYHNQSDCLNCIASAWLLTALSGKEVIDWDELFFWIINYINTQNYKKQFFELLWIKKIATILWYAHKRFGSVPQGQTGEVMTFQVQMIDTIQRKFTEQKIWETDNIFSLLFIACNHLSTETKDRCVQNKIWLKKLINQLPQFIQRSTSLQVSTKRLFELLWKLEKEYNVSVWEISNMDLWELSMIANEIYEEKGEYLQNRQHEHINKQLTLLITKLMESIHWLSTNKDPLNKRYAPFVDVADADEDTLSGEGDTTKSSINTATKEPEDNQTKKLTVEYFGNDLTKQASNNELDPVIGRSREIDQIIYTLLRKTKNSPMLIGEAWVGKTAIVEWLALRIATGDVPEKLKGHRIINLDVTGMIAGTKYRGEFEQRLKSVLEEASDPNNQIILFIDEIHTIIWAWWHDNNDMANSIKPMLSRGKIKLIGATTFDEYQKHIEKDAALKRRFQEINVDEPTGAQAIEILTGLKERFDSFHDVNISPKAIEHAVGLSMRYILNKHLPDKAIDLIDEAAARKSVLTAKLEENNNYQEHIDQLAVLEKQITKAVNEQDYYKAAELKQQESYIKNTIKQLRTSSSTPVHLRPVVDEHDIGKVISEKMWIPTHIINESEVEKLKSLQSTFDKYIFGQDEAVQKVIKAIQKSRLSIIPKTKPIASFLFLWPSWVGKTYIAKLIAEHYFYDPKSLIRIDMSEYMEKYSVSKIIWSAPWYVWYDEWWSLTEQIRRKPYSVLLFDEIEKADNSVLNILLQILDEWQLKDSKGRIIDFKNTIIIMTSNIWSEYFSSQGKQIWFNYKHAHQSWDEFDMEHTKSLIFDKLNEQITAELLNRIDHKIIFSPLNYNQLEQVFYKVYDQFKDQWKVHPEAIVPVFTKEEVSIKIKELYNPQYGARPIEKYIFNDLEDEVIKSLLTQK